VAIAAGEQCGARGRTHGVDVETVVAKSPVGELSKFGCIHWPAKGAGRGEPNIIQKNEDDIGRSRVRFSMLRPVGF
jgi:hypothetical protein